MLGNEVVSHLKQNAVLSSKMNWVAKCLFTLLQTVNIAVFLEITDNRDALNS